MKMEMLESAFLARYLYFRKTYFPPKNTPSIRPSSTIILKKLALKYYIPRPEKYEKNGAFSVLTGFILTM